VHASSLAEHRGAGRGGQRGPSEPALDGVSAGASRAQSSGTGAGWGGDIGSDPRLIDYFELLKNSVDWSQAFPRWAIARGLGGVVVTALTLRKEGSLASASVVRPSGVPEFDANVVTAIGRARLPAYPPELARFLGNRPLTVHIVWDATNPAVGREGPGPGQRGTGP
jgi:TonB family protein